MPRMRKKDISNPLTGAKFPMIFEHGKPKAFVVDIEKYREMELLVDNLINLREEEEDDLLRESGILEKLVAQAKEESMKSSAHTSWEDEIDAL